VRAGNLQDLVYKQGQAGVTKASVTIVFNNPDPNSSPIGYEQCKQITVTRQVVIGGNNKYMINGKTAQQSEVQNMFHSVQLNVNNPHFLIMQGRITKVLNMKPVEILSMIEEAAGTRMFQTKKEQAMKMIEKKQLKVDELTKVMDDEINPQLESLREKRQLLIEYQTNENEVERLERFCKASEYSEYAAMVDDKSAQRQSLENNKTACEALESQKKAEVADCEANIERMQEQLAAGMKSELDALKKREDDMGKELVQSKTQLKNHLETCQAEKDAAAALERQLGTAKASLVEKEGELAKCNAELAGKEAAVEAVEKDARAMCDKYQNAVAGVADETTAEVLSLPEQVAHHEKRAREAESQLKTGAQRSEHAKKQLKELQKTAKAQQADHGKGVKEVDALRQAIAALEGKLQASGAACGAQDVRMFGRPLPHHSPQPLLPPHTLRRPSTRRFLQEAALRSKAAQLQTSTAALKDEVERLTTQLEARLNFEFKDPERGFDRSKVKGLVAKVRARGWAIKKELCTLVCFVYVYPLMFCVWLALFSAGDGVRLAPRDGVGGHGGEQAVPGGRRHGANEQAAHREGPAAHPRDDFAVEQAGGAVRRGGQGGSGEGHRQRPRRHRRVGARTGGVRRRGPQGDGVRLRRRDCVRQLGRGEGDHAVDAHQGRDPGRRRVRPGGDHVGRRQEPNRHAAEQDLGPGGRQGYPQRAGTPRPT